jgi:hypothetical protein
MRTLKQSCLSRTTIQRIGLYMAIALLTACATDPVAHVRSQFIPAAQIQITDRFDTRQVTESSYVAEVIRCLPQANAEGARSEGIQKILEKSQNFIQLFGHPTTPRIFAVFKDQAWCIDRSEGGWPIYAGEALRYTADPIGPSQAVIDEWYRQIAHRLAVVGEARVAYNMPDNRHALLVTYWITMNFPRVELHYRHQQRVRGTWEHELLDLQFTHVQLKEVKTVKWGEGTIKPNPIAHRFYHLPR